MSTNECSRDSKQSVSMLNHKMTYGDASLRYYVRAGDAKTIQEHLDNVKDAYNPTYITSLIEAKKDVLAQMEYEVQHHIVQDTGLMFVGLGTTVLGPFVGLSKGEFLFGLILSLTVSLLFILAALLRPLKRRTIKRHAEVIPVLTAYCAKYADVKDQTKARPEIAV